MVVFVRGVTWDYCATTSYSVEKEVYHNISSVVTVIVSRFLKKEKEKEKNLPSCCSAAFACSSFPAVVVFLPPIQYACSL